MRDGGVTCKYRIPDEYSGFVVLERILWRHKSSPVSPPSVINTAIYNAIEPKYVSFFCCGLVLLKGIYTYGINYVELQL